MIKQLLPLASAAVLSLPFVAAQPAHARCPQGYTGSAGYNYCVPIDLEDRAIWEWCAENAKPIYLTPQTTPSMAIKVAAARCTARFSQSGLIPTP